MLAKHSHSGYTYMGVIQKRVISPTASVRHPPSGGQPKWGGAPCADGDTVL